MIYPHRGLSVIRTGMQRVWNSTCYLTNFSWKSKVRTKKVWILGACTMCGYFSVRNKDFCPKKLKIQDYIIPTKVWKSNLLYGGRAFFFWNSPVFFCFSLLSLKCSTYDCSGHKVKLQYMHCRLIASYILLPLRKMSRRSILFHKKDSIFSISNMCKDFFVFVFCTGVDWSEIISSMEVSAMLYNCTYCTFTSCNFLFIPFLHLLIMHYALALPHRLLCLKAYSLISYRGCSQKFQNWNFLHQFVAFLLEVHFSKGI